MTCGARIQVVRTTDWTALDAEVRDIMQRVWGIQPIRLGDLLLLPAGPPTAVGRLRASVECVRLQTEPQLLELQAGQGNPNVNLDWLDAFIREHEEHEH